MTTVSYPRESVEVQPFTLAVDGVNVLTGVEICLVPSGTRPTGWAAPITIGGKLGVLVSGFAVGIWDLWGRVTNSAPETPVVFIGSIRIS